MARCMLWKRNKFQTQSGQPQCWKNLQQETILRVETKSIFGLERSPIQTCSGCWTAYGFKDCPFQILCSFQIISDGFRGIPFIKGKWGTALTTARDLIQHFTFGHANALRNHKNRIGGGKPMSSQVFHLFLLCPRRDFCHSDRANEKSVYQSVNNFEMRLITSAMEKHLARCIAWPSCYSETQLLKVWYWKLKFKPGLDL